MGMNEKIVIAAIGTCVLAMITMLFLMFHCYANPVNTTIYVGIVSDVERDRIVIDDEVIFVYGISEQHWEIGEIHKVVIEEYYHNLFRMTECKIVSVEILERRGD